MKSIYKDDDGRAMMERWYDRFLQRLPRWRISRRSLGTSASSSPTRSVTEGALDPLLQTVLESVAEGGRP